ncbi:DUF305 domain-containing protein [Aeromicrobium senzhongii]|uniref:DUF305 domain-containing protein n=1 Tax=Aeromicrobium senzhongii TaxID=2663859 RepID=A0ABX6SPG9_9ACTN|nr:DUF305 domain-containing protein [Aeromicrobium senzhongii]QNL93263.1 DUF305 domain-containing protein [Aeromicrobium senzhongii]
MNVVLRPVALALAALALAGCGTRPQQVSLGGTKAADTAEQRGTVERPWGTVKTFPRLQKAEPPSAADVTFTRDMIMHHRQAVELSENVRTHRGLDARVGSAARFIIQDQKNEITTMRAWLQAWQDSAGTESHDHGADAMPGMLAQARVDELATLDRPAAEVAFLVAMIEHHEGAITMSQDYLPEQTNAFVRSTATHIIGEQTTEIAYMRNLLDERCGPKGPSTCPRD